VEQKKEGRLEEAVILIRGTHDMIKDASMKVDLTHSLMESVVSLLEKKIDYLIHNIVLNSSSDKVPLSVFKWIVIFLLVFNFALIFGVEGARKIFNSNNLTGISENK